MPLIPALGRQRQRNLCEKEIFRDNGQRWDRSIVKSRESRNLLLGCVSQECQKLHLQSLTSMTAYLWARNAQHQDTCSSELLKIQEALNQQCCACQISIPYETQGKVTEVGEGISDSRVLSLSAASSIPSRQHFCSELENYTT